LRGARSWVYELLAPLYKAEGEAAFQPRSRRPKASPRAISQDTVELIVRLRKELAGRDWTLGRRPSPGTCSSTTRSPVARQRLVTRDPSRRPKSS